MLLQKEIDYRQEKNSFHLFEIKVKKVTVQVQGDRLNIVVCCWYLVKSDLSCVHVCRSVHWTSRFLQGTRKTGHVELVTLYVRHKAGSFKKETVKFLF